MKTALLVFLALIVIWLLTRAIRHKSLYPFMSFRHNFGKRRDTFQKTLELLSEHNAEVLVETGTARIGLRGAKSNGASTIVFATWAQENNALLHSVDISEESINAAKAEVIRQGLVDYVKWRLEDSLEFLAEFNEPVDFLYLDSYDYDKEDTSIQIASQEHHLAEFKAIESRLHEKSLVLIDDCRLPNGGKGKLAIEYMLGRGWRILMNEYQILLVKSG
ncbi:MAG: class I SAM-dependent methyltransferase [Planctomycetota bacterium]